jgi:hypothetical protein
MGRCVNKLSYATLDDVHVVEPEKSYIVFRRNKRKKFRIVPLLDSAVQDNIGLYLRDYKRWYANNWLTLDYSFITGRDSLDARRDTACALVTHCMRGRDVQGILAPHAQAFY